MKDIIFDSDQDVVFVPFSPISSTDRFEIRSQLRNVGRPREIKVEAFLDDVETGQRLGSDVVNVKKNEFGFCQFFPNVSNQTGKHDVILRINADGESEIIKKPVEFRRSTPNLLEGTFLKFGPSAGKKECESTYDVRYFTDQEWRTFVDTLNEIGLKTIIIMSMVQTQNYWTRDTLEFENDLRAHFPSEIYPKSDVRAEDPLRAVLEAAQINGQHVFVPNGNQYNVPIRRMELMEELHAKYGHYPSFHGWYEPMEPHLNWNSRVLDGFFELAATGKAKANELSPVKPVLQSVACGNPGFSEYAFRRIAANDFVPDIVAPMDVVGCTRGRLEQMKYNHRSFSALRAAFDANGRQHLWGNAEDFDITDDHRLLPRYRNGGFDGPAGFVQQIECLRPYVEKIVSFTATGILSKPGFTPLVGGEAAVTMYKNYQAYAANPPPVMTNIARGLQYEKSLKPNYPKRRVVRLFEPNLSEHDPDQEFLATDGYLVGGLEGPGDITRVFGYSFETDSIAVDITFDLGETTRIDGFRAANCPTLPYSLESSDENSPDKITVSVGEAPDQVQRLGELSDYRHGWAELYPENPVEARFVTFKLEKSGPPEDDTGLMLVNEIEILREEDG